MNVEGQPSSIELLNDFDELRPLKIVAASRYAYEWSKLLKIRINERDWPNIKKTSTRHVMTSTTTTLTTTRQHQQQQQQQIVNNYYEAAPATAVSKQQYQQQFNRAASANASFNDTKAAAVTPPAPRKSVPITTVQPVYVNSNNYNTSSSYRPSATDYWSTPQRPDHMRTLGKHIIFTKSGRNILALQYLSMKLFSSN